MGSLRRAFQLWFVVGRGHCRLCPQCLPGAHRLRQWEEPTPHSVRRILLHPRVFLSARSDLKNSLCALLLLLPYTVISIFCFITLSFILSIFRYLLFLCTSEQVLPNKSHPFFWLPHLLYFCIHFTLKWSCPLPSVLGHDVRSFGK
jgi:hypothetical protein